MDANPPEDRRPVALETVEISKLFGGVRAVDRLSISIARDGLTSIVGPNGSGKSTVLKAVMGMAPVSSGTVYWRQQPLNAATHEIVKEGIAFVPQGRRVFIHLTIEENLDLGCLHLKDREERERRKDSVMDVFHILRDKRRDLASQMSGGQQQLLALGRGLMAAPEALLLDEPTLGLAPVVVKETFQKIAEISRRFKTTIFIVEHNIKSVLDKGRVVHDGTPESVRETGILTDVFLGRVTPGPAE